MRYLIKLAYNGSEFHGWQIQPNATTVQESIESCLTKIFSENINLVGCGRTDTGVHASDFYAHFDGAKVKYDSAKLVYKLNKMLPGSISIKALYPVNEDFHARFSATSRKYHYHISKHKNPFRINQVWFYNNSQELDLAKMKEAGAMLLNHDDFTSFAKLHTDAKTNICDVMEFNINETSDEIVIDIKANRFLRNMVRAIVGTIIEVGSGKLSLSDFEEIIKVKDRQAAAFSAPASGLFLSEIEYPLELLKEISI
jgi:tRNA pseudouridine38-40 synthase